MICFAKEKCKGVGKAIWITVAIVLLLTLFVTYCLINDRVVRVILLYFGLSIIINLLFDSYQYELISKPVAVTLFFIICLIWTAILSFLTSGIEREMKIVDHNDEQYVIVAMDSEFYYCVRCEITDDGWMFDKRKQILLSPASVTITTVVTNDNLEKTIKLLS